jgi:heme-degrading monooxygenase HmoA
MFVILWEFEVKPGSEERFQKAYRPDGPWVRLFQRDPHFRGTLLQRDPARPRFYFTIDIWDSGIAYKRFLSANRAAYEEIDRNSESLTTQERRVLSFIVPSPTTP